MRRLIGAKPALHQLPARMHACTGILLHIQLTVPAQQDPWRCWLHTRDMGCLRAGACMHFNARSAPPPALSTSQAAAEERASTSAGWNESGATCITCGIGVSGPGFASAQEQRAHFKTDWHRCVHVARGGGGVLAGEAKQLHKRQLHP